jgi:hypothetical protein
MVYETTYNWGGTTLYIPFSDASISPDLGCGMLHSRPSWFGVEDKLVKKEQRYVT